MHPREAFGVDAVLASANVRDIVEPTPLWFELRRIDFGGRWWFARVGNAVTGGRPKCPQFLPNFSLCPHSRFVPNSK